MRAYGTIRLLVTVSCYMKVKYSYPLHIRLGWDLCLLRLSLWVVSCFLNIYIVVLHHNLCINFFFSERVIPIWNSLLNSVVSASSTSTFKAHLSHIELTPISKLFPHKYLGSLQVHSLCLYWHFWCSFHQVNYMYIMST